MFDTNILISAVFSSSGSPSQSIVKAERDGSELCICAEIRREALEKFEEKWPELSEDFDKFLEKAGFTVLLTPKEEDASEGRLRDIKDRPIYRAAKYAQVDYFITGDKDFLEFEQAEIRIITAAEYLKIVD
jgi:predicted nucleic acid-binding protein